MLTWQRLRICPEQQPAEGERQHVIALERSPYSSWLRRNSPRGTHSAGVVTAGRVIQHATHATTLLKLQQPAGRAGRPLAAPLFWIFLLRDSQQHDLCLSARHPRRQQRESGRYGSLPYFREGHGKLQA
jgi:hypothetical protein